MDRKNVLLGIILVTVGAVMGLIALEIIPGISMLFVIAGGFLAAYFVFGRNIGFLIPGCVITAIAAYSTWNQMVPGLDGIYFLLLLGAAFIAVFLIHTMHLQTNYWGERYWPLFPGTILTGIAGLTLSQRPNYWDLDRKLFSLIVPAFLVIVGILVLVGGNRRTGTK